MHATGANVVSTFLRIPLQLLLACFIPGYATIVVLPCPSAYAAESIWAGGVSPPLSGEATKLSAAMDLASRHRYEQAAKLFASVHDFDLLNYRAVQSVLETYVLAGEFDRALIATDYLQARETKKGANITDFQKGITFKYKGDALSGKGNYDQAVRCYDAAVKLKPDSTYPILCVAGEILMKTHKYKEAIKVLDEAVAKGCPNGIGYKHLGQCYLESGQPAEAEKPLKQAISTFTEIRKTKPDGFTIGLIGSYKMLVKCYKLQGKTALAASTQKTADSMASSWNETLFGASDPGLK